MSNRIVKLPSVESFGRLTPDKWLALKNLEESAELVEACKQYLKASDPTDPSGIGREFDDHANCLACFGVNVGGELGDDRDKAMPLGKKFKVRLTITPEETGTPVDMLGFTFTSGRNGRMELDTEYNNIPKLADDGLDSLSILVILKTLEMWAQKGYELFQPIAQRFHGGRR